MPERAQARKLYLFVHLVNDLTQTKFHGIEIDPHSYKTIMEEKNHPTKSPDESPTKRKTGG